MRAFVVGFGERDVRLEGGVLLLGAGNGLGGLADLCEGEAGREQSARAPKREQSERTHLELGDVEPIHVVNMRIEPPSQVHVLAKLLSAEALESLLAEGEARLDELDVRTFPQSVGDDRLVLLGRDAAGRVDDVASFLRVGGDRVDRAEDELLLEVGEEGEVALGLE